ncbi:MAG: methylenetetrahydrofolate reductase [Candidatus Omnitrophota bacterium]
MKISEILKQNQQGVAFEFFPPRSEQGRAALINTIKALAESKPLYASMTCGAGGTVQGATKEAVSLLLKERNFEVMPHLTCLDLEPDTLKGLLDDYQSQGIENIMALRGDPPQDVSNFSFSGQNFFCARALVKAIKDYGHFCIGVAVYPEGHIEASTLDQDLEYARQKIDAGADFAVTQMFFDNSYYYRLLERMKKQGVNIPVLPGILPLTDLAKVKQFASICRTTIPKNIEETMAKLAGKPREQEKAGVDFTIRQCQDLLKNGAKKLHFFTLNQPEIIKTILKAIFTGTDPI